MSTQINMKELTESMRLVADDLKAVANRLDNRDGENGLKLARDMDFLKFFMAEISNEINSAVGKVRDDHYKSLPAPKYHPDDDTNNELAAA